MDADRYAQGSKRGTKSTASLATLAAGLAGMPVCMAPYMNQMNSAVVVKKQMENQSMAAAALRAMVGSAKAASTARPGRASRSARSLPPISTLAPAAVNVSAKGAETWGAAR